MLFRSRVKSIVDGLLWTFGVAADALPETLGERAEALRVLLASQRVLIVLDDVSASDGPAFVQSLLPEDDGRSLLIVTCARTFGAPRSMFLELAMIPPEAGLAVLESDAGPERIAHEPTMAGVLVEMYERSPLMLRIASKVLAMNPSWGVGDLHNKVLEIPADWPESWLLSRPEAGLLAQLYEGLGEPAATILRRLALVDEHDE